MTPYWGIKLYPLSEQTILHIAQYVSWVFNVSFYFGAFIRLSLFTFRFEEINVVEKSLPNIWLLNSVSLNIAMRPCLMWRELIAHSKRINEQAIDSNHNKALELKRLKLFWMIYLIHLFTCIKPYVFRTQRWIWWTASVAQL